MKRPRQILVVDDEANIRKFLKKSLERDGYEVRLAGTGEEALTSLEDERPDLLVLDVWLPDANGMDLLSDIRRTDPDLPIIIITAFGEIKMAVEAIKAGASDFVVKPFDFVTIQRSIEKALKILEMREDLDALKSVWERGQYMGLIGQSPVMKDLFRTLKRIGTSSSTTVLITGETGAGKEVAARAIHQNSERNNKAFVAVNCATLDDQLLESELFGHTRGAFTDAKANKPGLFEVADGGTLFLDEIGETSPAFQVKLLRVLQEGELERVGGGESLKIDVRIVAATNRDLREAIAEGRFREDFYYRLNVFSLEVSALKERRDDIPLLVDHFLRRFSLELGKEVVEVDDEVMGILLNYEWPGNVRELENTIERAVVLAEGDSITRDELPPHLLQTVSSETPLPIPRSTVEGSLIERTDRLESDLIQGALERFRWNKTKAAEH
ncbi:MAG: sigma-54-dependent Fis family transcriptional regulator, partial [Candidatus Omnitrophica bacterium]|nr:sigma-54-dependent Fis family transcriptional regulator [Candidatus Omnitrophota bacterium]